MTTLNRATYQRLIDEDLAWLDSVPRTLERDHVIAIVRASLNHEYPRACAEARPSIEPGWQPIATCPRDNTLVLLGSIEHGSMQIGCGFTAEYQNGGEYRGPEIGCEPYWYYTHWRPLPLPPRAEALAPHPQTTENKADTRGGSQ